MARDRSRRFLFDTVVDLYDEARPRYPAVMLEEIVRTARLGPGSRVLEVGPGTGQATVAFAARGFDVLAIELGANLAARTRENVGRYPSASVLNLAFEDWPVEESTFDLVASGSAWHWIDPLVGYERAWKALRPGGWLALFWNRDAKPQGGVYSAIRQAYAERAPDMERHNREAPEREPSTEREKEIAESGFFAPPIVKGYPWSRELSTDDYLKLCCTYSDHIALPEDRLADLLEGVRQAVDQHGGFVERQYLTRLYLARRLDEPSG